MKFVYITFMIVLAGVFSAASICAPELLADNNFLSNFINHEILALMGTIMAISIASIATIHIWFNELEQKHGKRVFGAARREINQAAFLMIWLFVGQLVLLIFRSMAPATNKMAVSFFNGTSVLLLLATVITLVDVMGTVRSLTPADD